MKKEYISSSASQTKKIARSLAPLILKKWPKNQVLIIALEGELGSGKTTFLQGFAKGLGIKEKILSPTFVIYKKYNIPSLKETRPLKSFFHVDCYRIKKTKELIDLGFKEIISDQKNIVAIEWADKIKKILPKTTVWIDFEFLNQKSRKLIFREQFSD